MEFKSVSRTFIPKRGDMFDHGGSLGKYKVTRVANERFYFKPLTGVVDRSIFGAVKLHEEQDESSYELEGNTTALQWSKRVKPIVFIRR